MHTKPYSELFQTLLNNLEAERLQSEIFSGLVGQFGLPHHRTSLPLEPMILGFPGTDPTRDLVAWFLSKEEEIQRLAESAYQSYFALRVGAPTWVFVGYRGEVRSELLRRWAIDYGVIAFPVSETEDVKQADIPRWLLRHAASVVPLVSLSPYQTAGPVLGNRFFGREPLLASILTLNQRNYIVAGIRGIGKSSLLNAIAARLSHRQGCTVCRIGAEGAATHSDFLRQMALELDPPAVKLVVEGPDAWTRGDVRRFVARVTGGGKKHTIIVADEMDEFIRRDKVQDYEFLHGLRSACEAGMLSSILAGGRVLRDSVADHASPLYNFGRSIPLDRFSRDEVKALIVEPMQDMGVQVHEPSSCAGQLTEASGGHPQVVQRLLVDIIERLHAEDNRALKPQHVSSTIHARETLAHFRQGAEASADAKQLAVLWVLALEIGKGADTRAPAFGGEAISLESLGTSLQRRMPRPPPVESIQGCLERLYDLGILNELSGKWGFASPVYAKAVTEQRDLEAELRELSRRLA